MTLVDIDNLDLKEVGFLPIIKDYAKQINLVETINNLVQSQMDVSSGHMVLAMVLDTLSCRSPLYRLQNFFQDKDTGLLLGKTFKPEAFADHNVGRVLDKIFETGTQKIFSQLAQNAVQAFNINTDSCHFDTTSISVSGDYEFDAAKPLPPFNITYGHSKDHRPDLKQFMISMLCVDKDIPIFGRTEDGNASDKTINNKLLGKVSKHMAKHGIAPEAFIYVADSALVSPGNLTKMQERVLFLTRLPATYNECSRVIQKAVSKDQWIEIGTMAGNSGTAKRPAAEYKFYESNVTLYDESYRAVVVHSTALDKRKIKRIDRLINKNRKLVMKKYKEAAAVTYYCRPDAEAAAEKLCRAASGTYHKIEYQVMETPKFPRGCPPKNKPRKPRCIEYHLDFKVSQNDEELEPLYQEAGCFVLLTNLSDTQNLLEWPGSRLLSLYKEQNGIERNFRFLKDPTIVNSIFLKTPHRIEVLGLIILISLLIWRLMERTMRQYVERKSRTLTGWDNKQTKKPTSFMMTTKFPSILILRLPDSRRFARPLKKVQLEFLKALNVKPDVFLLP